MDDQKLLDEIAELHAKVDRAYHASLKLIDVLAKERDAALLQNSELQAAYDKQKKHNGAMEIAVQEAHRDMDAANRLVGRLQKMLNEIRGYVTKTAYGPGEHEMEGQILRIIEDAPSEKRNRETISQGNYCNCTESFNRNGVCTRCGWPVR